MHDVIHVRDLKRRVVRKVSPPGWEGPLGACAWPNHHEGNIKTKSMYDTWNKKTTMILWTFEHSRVVDIDDRLLDGLNYDDLSNYANSVRFQFTYDLYAYYMIGDM